jgi:hypothetical protein
MNRPLHSFNITKYTTMGGGLLGKSKVNTAVKASTATQTKDPTNTVPTTCSCTSTDKAGTNTSTSTGSMKRAYNNLMIRTKEAQIRSIQHEMDVVTTKLLLNGSSGGGGGGGGKTSSSSTASSTSSSSIDTKIRDYVNSSMDQIHQLEHDIVQLKEKGKRTM